MRHIRTTVTIFLLFVLTSCQIAPEINRAPTPTAPAQVINDTAKAKLQPTLTSSGPTQELTVAAAADLQFAFTDIAKLYEQKTGTKVTLVFGSTGLLAQQIENGAPYDMIAAADKSYVDQLVTKGLAVQSSAALYARGRIVLAVNRQSGVQATMLNDLLSDKIKHVAIANPQHAPYGLAAKQALQELGLWDQLQAKLVYGENVTQTLQFVQTGNAEVGIISLSVANVPEITWTMIDGSLYSPLDQELAVLTASKHPEVAADFIAFINGENGRPIMRKYGFLLPDEIPLLTTQQPTATP